MRVRVLHFVLLCALAVGASGAVVPADAAPTPGVTGGVASPAAPVTISWPAASATPIAPTAHVRPAAPAFPASSLAPAAPAPAALAAPASLAAPPTANGPSFGTGFGALLDNTTLVPPDTNGAVGPNHVMTMLNTEVLIQDRSGAILAGPTPLNTWWGSAGHFDPKVVYDRLSGRWFATVDQNSRSASSTARAAVSASADPTGTWFIYDLAADPSGVSWADFPGIGISTDKVVVTNNMYDVAGVVGFTGVKMWVLDKVNMLAGAPVPYTVFAPGFDTPTGPVTGTGFTMKPCMQFDAIGDVYLVDNWWLFPSSPLPAQRLSRITGPAGSATWAPVNLIDPDGFYPAGSFLYTQLNAAQPAPAALPVSTNDTRISGEPMLRNGHVWVTHSGGLPFGGTADRTAVFWYQVDPNAVGLPVVQSGVIDPGAGGHYYFPSIAVNMRDDVVIGFSVSDAGTYASGAYTSRFATDPAGQMDPVTVFRAGLDPYVKTYGSGRNRWGDYSATVVDPLNDLNFWTIQEYADTASPAGSGADGTGRWGTWWARIDAVQPPVLTCPPSSAGAPIPLECNQSGGGFQGALSGFSITDPGGAYRADLEVAIDGGPPYVLTDYLAGDGPFSITFGGTWPTPPLAPGAHTLDVTVRNSYGLTDSCTTYVLVQDTTPPNVSAYAMRRVLWPPRLGMLPIALQKSANDVCDPAPTFTVSVYSDEVVGAFAPDAVVSGTDVRLRAERGWPAPTFDGRVYLVVVTATDMAGNAASTALTVTVPLVPTAAWLMAVNTEASQALSDWGTTGSPPASWPATPLLLDAPLP